MTGFIRHNRRITSLIGLAAGLLAAAPGILTEIEVSFDMTAETGLLFLLSFSDVPRMQHALDILNKESYTQLDALEEERGHHYRVVRRETRIGA